MADASPQRTYQYHGDLEQTALPEILYTVYLHRVPGVIEAQAGEVLKRIFVHDGAVIHASSTDLEDSLGHFLKHTGRLTEQQFADTMNARGEVDKRYGELLIERRILSPAQLYEAIQEQIRSVVWSLFSWPRGEIRFSIGEFEDPEMIRIHLPMRQMILEGVRRASDVKALVARLGRKDTILEPTWTTEDLVEIALTAEELDLLQLVDGSRSLYELCTTGPWSPAENARLLYGFHVLRLMKRNGGDRKSAPVKIRLKTGS